MRACVSRLGLVGLVGLAATLCAAIEPSHAGPLPSFLDADENEGSENAAPQANSATEPATGEGYGEEGPPVRVAIHRDDGPTLIKSPGGQGLRIAVINTAGEHGEIVGFSPTTLTLTPTARGVTISGLSGEFTGITLDSATGQATLNGKLYATPLEIIRDPIAGGTVVVTEVPLERYLRGVVGHEMVPTWTLEALKSQAVAARTFALSQRLSTEANFYHVEATVISQVYGGEGRIADNVARAVDETRGEVLAYENQPIIAYFFANCVGETSAPEDVFGKPLPYLAPASCDTGERAPKASWKVTVSHVELDRAFAKAGLARGAVTDIDVAARRGSRPTLMRVESKKGGSVTVPPTRLRQALGFTRIPSNDFKVDVSRKGATFTGRGFGHGVGLCQWCAKGMAERGDTHAEILRHFYPGATLVKMY
jgi:stage II sporulation protein D